MPKLIIFDDDGESTSLAVSVNETPNAVLKHYGMDPDFKIVYLNGKILSREKMNMPFQKEGSIFMAIRNKVVYTD